MIKRVKEKIKKNNGFTGQDILIALFILMLFLSAFTTIMINLSSTTKEIDDMKKITEKITKIADKVDAMKFEDVGIKIEDEEITKLIGNDGNTGAKNLKVFYTVEGDEESKTITLKVKKVKSDKNIPEENVFEMKLSKQVVTIESDTGDGSGNGDGSGDGTGTKPIESVEHIGTTEKTETKLIGKNTIKFINAVQGTSYNAKEGDLAISYSNTNQTVLAASQNTSNFTNWEGFKIVIERWKICC